MSVRRGGLAYLNKINCEAKMKRFKLVYFVIILLVFLFIVISCTPSEETQKEKQEDSIYVFDKVPPENLYEFEQPEEEVAPEGTVNQFIVQIGAFTTIERANEFADFSRRKLNKDIKVNFNEKANLYVVQIHPPFDTKGEAENYRDQLRNYEEFNDAWIVTVKKEK